MCAHDMKRCEQSCSEIAKRSKRSKTSVLFTAGCVCDNHLSPSSLTPSSHHRPQTLPPFIHHHSYFHLSSLTRVRFPGSIWPRLAAITRPKVAVTPPHSRRIARPERRPVRTPARPLCSLRDFIVNRVEQNVNIEQAIAALVDHRLVRRTTMLFAIMMGRSRGAPNARTPMLNAHSEKLTVATITGSKQQQQSWTIMFP